MTEWGDSVISDLRDGFGVEDVAVLYEVSFSFIAQALDGVADLAGQRRIALRYAGAAA